MSKLTAVAERIAQTRRWLDDEADRLAARLDQFERDAPATIRNAHRVLDELRRELDVTGQMIQQWASLPLEVAGGLNKSTAPQQAGARQLTRALPKQSSDDTPAPLDTVRQFLGEQQKDAGRIERALQTLASDLPTPQHVIPGPAPRVQPKQSDDVSPVPVDPARRSLEEQQKHEDVIERALQTLANKLHAPQHSAANPSAPVQKDEDVSKQATRKLGAVRAA